MTTNHPTKLLGKVAVMSAALLTAAAPAFAQPVITRQPQNVTTLAGTPATFTVEATGTPPLSYQWRSYANTTVFTNIPGATNASLVLVNVQPTPRRFGVEISNSEGSAVSATAQLLVLVPVTITSQPSGMVAEIGSSLTNQVAAAGTTPLSYQWRWNGVNLPGRTTTTLVLVNAQFTNAGDYTVVVSNVVGVVTSRVAAVTLVPRRSRFDVPAAIARDPAAAEPTVQVRWPTTPGKTYNVLTADRVNQAWAATNVGDIQATSSLTEFTERADRAARLYRVREQIAAAGNTAPITLTTVTEAEKILGLTFTTAERTQMLELLNDPTYWNNRGSYEAMRTNRLVNSDPPALVFNPVPRGFVFEQTQQPINWSPPQSTAVPANFADLAFFTVRDLGELIRTRQLMSTELTQLCLARLRRYDTNLICVVTLTEQLALQQAARADAEIAAGMYRGPLHGIPYGIKDLFAARGYPTTWGAAPYRDQLIDEDATVVKKLEAAGAVLVAKLSLGSLALGDVWYRGRTRNPWNVSEGSSGSSAGSAAATAAGLVPFAIGTETLGSIVSPCTFCRVTGLRPTFGRVSRTGGMALSWSMDKVGPICRAVEDCAIVFEAIRGADGLDESVLNPPFNYNPNINLATLRVGYWPGLGSLVTNQLAALVGPAQLSPMTLPQFPYAAMTITLDAEAAAAFDDLTRLGADDLLTSQGRYDWPNIFRTARTIPAVEYIQANRLRHKLIQDMAAVMQTVDVWVTDYNDDAALYVSNLTGQPCAVIPNGGSTSLSFIGRLYGEATILALARAYQNSTALHTNRPPLFVQ